MREQEGALRNRFPDLLVHYIAADFTLPLDIPPLNGLVIANALHFHRRKEPVVELLKSYLRPGGRFLLVEYNVDQGNHWVPYPISYSSWESLAKRCGFTQTHFLASRPSHFLREIYSAEGQ
jgi:SAM-dependent methyltransferase